jgi:hypothetical protein
VKSTYEHKPRAKKNRKMMVLYRLEIAWERLERTRGRELELQEVLDHLLEEGQDATHDNLRLGFRKEPAIADDTGR